MNRKLICLGIVLVIAFKLAAANGEYAVNLIPASLIKNANAVKRKEIVEFEILQPGEAILKKKFAITVLNESGDEFAAFVGFYDKFQQIRNIEGTLFDASGRELKKLKNKQIMDFSGVGDDDLIDDTRLKVHNFAYRTYPYTVQYEVEIKYTGTMFFPKWMPREKENISVEQSLISIIHPADYEVRYKVFNYSTPPLVSPVEKGKKIMTWQVKELPAIDDEYASPGWTELNTTVIFGPSDFEVGNYKGNMKSWQDFGKFVYALKQGRDELPESIRGKVNEIAGKYSNVKDKIFALYSYLQQTTRYISIQLGIGGWQPFDAKFVAGKSYGDCKALTNYMYSLLKAAGINSYYTLVRAGDDVEKLIEDFPSSQFNHVILCVPVVKDTIWLECTSQTVAPGYLGAFTGNRSALLVDESGGKVVRTPVYGINENRKSSVIKAELNENGTLHVDAYTRYSGLLQDNFHKTINNLSKDKLKDQLRKELDLGTYEITSFNYAETRSSIPVIDEKLEIVVDNYASVTGKRLFIQPNIMTRFPGRLPTDKERKFDLELGWGYEKSDTIEIVIPAGYVPEAVPENQKIETPFGNYYSSLTVKDNKLYYLRSLKFKGGRFPPTVYADLAKFYETIYKADRNKVVLVKN